MQDAQPPIPEYDALPLGEVQSRLRTLDVEQLTVVVEYERSHAARPAVLAAADARLAELRTGAEPSGGSPAAPSPAAPEQPQGGSRVTPQTEGPPLNPPSQGVPGNPSDPR